jgi:predicted ABC-class ATPase
MRSGDDLDELLARIDGRGYKAYKDIRGGYALGDGVELHVDHVQGDPFAAPSKLRVRIAMTTARIPAEWFGSRVREIALRDALARELRRAIRGDPGTRAGHAGSGKSGLVSVDAGGQQVLERSAVAITSHFVEARVELGLPASGRRVRGRAARTLLLDTVPTLAEDALCWDATDRERIRALVECVEQQESIRGQLAELGLVAFVGNGARLARESGASDRPMASADCVPFRSPPSLEVEIDGQRGMGIPRGVTLIVGGGYHGKSTLLRALERAVHPHIPGDGRERVVSAPDLVKIRAEDGRSVDGVDIHAFVRQLPGASGDTRCFSSRDASGSTSQAANIVEALEAGASGILLDEDTSATNFMLRDARMQALVARDAEPITPFVDRVRELWRELAVSTVLVMGGCGDYFDAADTVIRLCEYQPDDASEDARRIAAEHPTARARDAVEPLARPAPRRPLAESFDASRGRHAVKIAAKARDALEYGELRVDLRGLEQLVDISQTRALGLAIHWIAQQVAHRSGAAASLPELLDALDAFLDREGLDPLDPWHRPEQHPGNLARPRRYEVAAAINRMRSLRVAR